MLKPVFRHWARYRLFYQLLFFAVLLLGLYLGMRPGPPPTPLKFSLETTLYHTAGLFVCTILSYLAYPRWRWWWRGAFMFGVGVAVEYVQSYHPARTADMHDIYANTVGVILGLVVVCIHQRPPRRE